MTSGCVGVGIGSSNNVKTKKIMYDLSGDLNELVQSSDVVGDPKPKGDIPESLIPEPDRDLTPKSRT